jgi:hypothetical protein
VKATKGERVAPRLLQGLVRCVASCAWRHTPRVAQRVAPVARLCLACPSSHPRSTSEAPACGSLVGNEATLAAG